MSIATLLKRALPGSKSSVAGHIGRGERIAHAIQQRFGISEPRQWQVKHLRWVLERWAGGMSDSTRYDYWRTVRALVSVLNHWPDWSIHLRGPWCKPGIGGRPPKLSQLQTAVTCITNQ
jgi:hypothetical protein